MTRSVNPAMLQETAQALGIDPLFVERDWVLTQISYREDVIFDPRPLLYNSPFRDPFPVAVMDPHEMVAEKVRALYQRGNPRDLFDLWFIYSLPGLSVEAHTVARLIPTKFRLVGGGWRREHIYDRIRANEGEWQRALHLLVTTLPKFDDALATVEAALRPVIQALP